MSMAGSSRGPDRSPAQGGSVPRSDAAQEPVRETPAPSRPAPVGPLPGPSGATGPDERTAGSRKRRIILFSVVGLVALAGLLYGIHTITFYAHHAVTDDAQFEGDISPVLPRVAGYVTEVDAAENQSVQEGQVLLRID